MGDPKPEFDYNLWRQLDPEYLKDQWAWRQSVFGWQTASGVLSATAWFLLLPPLVAFAWVQSRGGKYRIAVHGGIAFAAIALAAIAAAVAAIVAERSQPHHACCYWRLVRVVVLPCEGTTDG